MGGAVGLPRSRWASRESGGGGGGGGVTGHRHTERLLAGQSAAEPGSSSTEHRVDEQCHTRGPTAEERRGWGGGSGPLRRTWTVSDPLWASLPLVRGFLWTGNGVTVNVGEVPTAASMKKNNSGKRVSVNGTDTGPRRLVTVRFMTWNRSSRNKSPGITLRLLFWREQPLAGAGPVFLFSE